MLSKQNNFVRYTVIRKACGLVFGKNAWDLLLPERARRVTDVIGAAGLRSADFAAFRGVAFDDELNRDVSVHPGDEIILVHRDLLSLPREFLLNAFTALYPNRLQ